MASNLRRPTVTWKNELPNINGLNAEQAITDSDKLLDRYTETLQNARNEVEMWEAIAKVVKGFDELNIKHNYFIKSDEADELSAYIQQCAEAHGLKYDGDFTEEWRTEW
jgi:hypothetical protein